MLLNPDRYWWLIPGSLLAAFLFQFWPLPQPLRAVAPDAIVLVTLYWTLRKPQLVSSGWAFVIGVLRDGIEASPLGMHALALVVVSYLVQLFYQRLRMFTVWQQALAVAGLCELYLLLGDWVHLLDPRSGTEPVLFLPALVTGLCWLPLSLLLRQLEEGSLRTAVRN